MKRLYYLAASVSEVRDTSDDLHQQGVSDWRFHTFCQDERGIAHRLRSADVLDRSELFRSTERGITAGGRHRRRAGNIDGFDSAARSLGFLRRRNSRGSAPVRAGVSARDGEFPA